LTIAAAFFGTTVHQISLQQTASNQRHVVDSRPEEGSSGCWNANKCPIKKVVFQWIYV